MTTDAYDRVDEFVDNINESASRVGDVSIYKFNKFRWVMGAAFIVVTTVAVAFIIAEFVRKFEFEPVLGVNVYYIGMAIGLATGGLFAYHAEGSKIESIKGAVFSEGINRTMQWLSTMAIIATLIGVNAKGIQGIADFSLRYMNAELENSVQFKIKQEKMKVHQKISNDTKIGSVDKSDIQALMRSRTQLEQSRDREIRSIQAVRDNYINNHDKRAYRTMIANKKAEAAKKIGVASSKWEKQISKIDWKISKAKGANLKATQGLADRKAKELDKADKAADELVSYYSKQSETNEATIKEYADIGIFVAVSGEVIDGVLAMILFLLVKSNPNTNGTPKVDIGTRALRDRVVAQKRKTKTVRPVSREVAHPKPQALPRSSKSRVGRELFDEIERVAMMIAHSNDRYVDGHLKHATQREIVAEFDRQGRSVTPLEIRDYLAQNKSELIFINQKVGFVYKEREKEVA